VRNSEIVSKLLCPTHNFGCISMVLKKKDAGKRIRIRWLTGRSYHVLFMLCRSYENSLTSKFCLKLLKLKISSGEIVGITLIGNGGHWPCHMQSRCKVQTVSFYSGRSQILLSVKRHVQFHSSVDIPNSEI